MILREDFKRVHKGTADFCNEVPNGIHSPEAIKVYEIQRDLKLKTYTDQEFIKSTEEQINDLMGNILDELKRSISLSDTDIRTIIYDICGFNYKTIALLLNVNPSAVATRRTRIKDKLLSSPPMLRELLTRHTTLVK